MLPDRVKDTGVRGNGMYLSQHYLKGLGCMSYLVGDEATSEAAVIDPQIDVAQYVEEAEAAGLTIRHVLDTHLHADHVSGNRALAARTGATVYLSARAKAGFPFEGMREGSEVRMGNVLLRARETPGHTPEHLTFEVHDLSRGTDRPYALLTGDTLFVGSVGRPDLVATTGAGELGAMLYDSFRNVLCPMPDSALVFPGHGAGSACGANMGRLLSSTLGYEKEVNSFLQETAKDRFVAAVTANLPSKPGNAVNMKRINAQGPPMGPVEAGNLKALDPGAFGTEVGDGRGVLVLDTSEPDAWAANHVPGSVNVTLGPAQFPNRAAYFLEWNQPLYLVLADEGTLEDALVGLARVGGFDVRGYLEGGIAAWRNAGKPFDSVTIASAQRLQERGPDGDGGVLDVRTEREWGAGHIQGATWVPWERLVESVENLDANLPWTLVCGSGYRSSMAASILKREGFREVSNLLGGMTAWEAMGGPTVTEPSARKQTRAA